MGANLEIDISSLNPFERPSELQLVDVDDDGDEDDNDWAEDDSGNTKAGYSSDDGDEENERMDFDPSPKHEWADDVVGIAYDEYPPNDQEYC